MIPIPHRFPSSLARSTHYHVTIDGLALDVLKHSAADYASFECTGPVRIEITLPAAYGKVFLRPLRFGIQHEIEGRILRFTLVGPQYLQIEIAGLPLLYLYALRPAPATPSGPHVKCFEAGKIHDVGQVLLKSGEVCWIEAGAVLRGNIRAECATNVLIGGYGVLEGGIWPERGEIRRKAIVLELCTDCRVEDILMLSPCSWMVVLGGCSDVEVSGVRQIADDVSSDGVDIVGSKRIRVTGCILHNGDDNIAIKALNDNPGQNHERWSGNVEDVIVSRCIFYNTHGGSAMEIGYETSTDHIRDIRFEDIDVLAVHNFGSVFGIHTGDRAQVENVTWENIRVEHHYDKLVDIRVLWSRWNRDSERGRVRNLVFRNIRVVQSPPNAGYTLSVIAGYDAAHTVSGVLFDRFELGGRHVLNADQLDLVTRHADNVTFQ
ncbi:MAG: glycosyl hydrolase family 28 protein [Rariglobus sp.]|nr:glycosyl hydrolase family 28 protein [Rariglobus sp.]